MTTKRLSPLALVAALALVPLAGCGDTSPTGVCKHMQKLAKADGRDDADDPDALEKCTEDVNEMKEELGDKYDEFAKCVLSKSEFKAARKECKPDKL